MTPEERAKAIDDASWASSDDLRDLIEEHITAAVEEMWWTRVEPVLYAVVLRVQYILCHCRGEDEVRAEAKAILRLVEAAISVPPQPSSGSGGGSEVR